MIQRLDCMKSLLHLFYKHGTASAKSLRNNGLRTLSQANVTPHSLYPTFYSRQRNGKMEVGVPGRRKEWALGKKKKKVSQRPHHCSSRPSCFSIQ